MKIISKKRVTYKKKQVDINFALESQEGDFFSWYRLRILPTSPGLVNPALYITIEWTNHVFTITENAYSTTSIAATMQIWIVQDFGNIPYKCICGGQKFHQDGDTDNSITTRTYYQNTGVFIWCRYRTAQPDVYTLQRVMSYRFNMAEAMSKW